MKAIWLKILLAIVLPVLLAAWILYPSQQTLKKGIDLAGGTSLIYEIDTTGLDPAEQKDLALRMIEILRRRVDPGNIQNLVWRPHGNTRFEIQMPLANPQARARRMAYLEALNQLLERNVLPSTIIRSFKKQGPEREADLQRFAQNDPNRLRILNELATLYDQKTTAQLQADELKSTVEHVEQALAKSGLSLEIIKARRTEWIKQDPNQLGKDLDAFILSQDPNADPNTRSLLSQYVATYRRFAQVSDQLANRETGLTMRYQHALAQLERFSLTTEQIEAILEMPARSKDRAKAIEALKADFPDRAELIDRVVAAFDQYRPERGRLDDPADLQRMLKGAGVLEFRILPTWGTATGLSPEEINTYISSLSTKGPKYASDQRYVWAEVENPDEWRDRRDAILGQFGKKIYVLASNLPDECMLHLGTQRQWKLERAYPTADQWGRRAIGFQLDERGGLLFANITGHNEGRPLCILLDGVAISAPTIRARIYRSGIIEGNFTATQVTDMVNKLNAGSLPARLIEQPVSVRTIGPSLGEDNLRRSLRAGYIGLAIVVAGMLIYYLKAGAIAVAAMLMNLLITLAVMAMIQATFTLAGVAGVILTIGMTLDANVLIYERIREEQAKGSGIGFAIKNGYKRAFTTILDSNLTTMIPAVILYLIATEEIKGFAIVLMLGLATNLYTGVYVTRIIFEWMLAHGLLKDRLTMLSLVPMPRIDWMRLRPVFVTLSGLAIIGGLAVFFTRDPVKNNKYDIEFTGGMSIQLNFKEGLNLTRQQVQDRLRQAATGISQALASANVYSVGTTGRQFEITTTETNKTRATITFEPNQTWTRQMVLRQLQKTQAKLGQRLRNLSVAEAQQPNSFVIITSVGNRSLVKNILTEAFHGASISEPTVEEVVKQVIERAFADQLDIHRNLQPSIISASQIDEAVIEAHPELADFIGGVMIDCSLQQQTTLAQITQRISDLLFKPDTQQLGWCTYRLFGPGLARLEPNAPVSRFVYVTVHPEAGLRSFSDEEWAQYVENEKTRVLTATSLETSLPRVTQIDPSIGGEQKQRALIAIVLSVAAMMGYIWLRFGSLRYGLGAAITLVHDVCIMLGAVTACTYIARTALGQALLIGDFKIDLTMVAAFLTLVGYSLNDTIVIYDRIRENRKKAQLTALTINASINQTMSRTLITSISTLVVIWAMYIYGGEALRGFNYCMGLGIIIGTYSSIAISAPILLIGRALAKGQQPS